MALLTYIKIIFLFKNEYYFGYLDYIVYTLIALLPLLIAIAFFTLAERKAMASIQRRKGCNVVGVWGFLQPFADGLKLIIKEIIIPNKANKFLFIFGSSLTLFLSLIG
jgi:NADH-quinone oxidoreductase subunit H